MLRLRNKRIEANVRAGMLRRKWVWLRRIGHCKGFGVQSPWAYGLVTTVINGRGRQDAYERLKDEFGTQSYIGRKLSELYLRLADRLKPQTIIDTAESDEAFRAYVLEGNSAAELKRTESTEELSETLSATAKDRRLMVRIVPDDEMEKRFDAVKGHQQDGLTVVVEGIHLDHRATELWNRIVTELPGVVTFDLYYCGLVFFDRKRYKQNYIINF